MSTPAPSSRRPAGPPRRLVSVLPVAALILALVAFPGLGRGQDAPLAEGDAQVIAQGLTSPPADRVAWRVLTEPVPVRADARPSNRMPSAAGFVLASDTPVFISDQDTKRRYRLAPGEAEFVPTGANQTWASLGEAAGSVYSIELADRDIVRDAGTGEILVVGNSFAMPEGDYDLNLIRDTVEGGEEAAVRGGDFPVLIFATAGAVDVSSTRAEETVRIGRGEGKVFGGDISILGRGDTRSTYVAAVIGEAVTGGRTNPTAVPAEETPEPEDAPTEEPTAEPTQEVAPTGTPEPEATATEATATEATATEATATEATATEATAPQAPLDEPIREATPEGASVRIAIRICRDGMTVVNLNPRGCQRASGNYRLALVTPDGTRLRLNDATRVDPSFVRWSGLAPGLYALIVGDLPRGYVTYSLDGFACCPIVGGYLISVPEEGLLDGTLYLLQDFPPTAPAAPVAVATAAPAGPSAPVASGDSDGDGISNANELNIYGTSPNLVDSDGDTIPDGVEAYGSNGYLTKPAVPDSDGDGVDDNVEIRRGTNPTNRASR